MCLNKFEFRVSDVIEPWIPLIVPLQGPPPNIDCKACSHSILRGLVVSQGKMRRLGVSLLVVVSALALATFHAGRERTELFLHAGRTAYGPDGGYSPTTRRYPVDKSALAAYLPQTRQPLNLNPIHAKP